MTGSDFNFGMPDWFLKLIAVMATIGALAVASSVICGIVWFVKHIQFVP